jgi:hypothetical protein
MRPRADSVPQDAGADVEGRRSDPATQRSVERIRITLEFSRSDDPRLFQALAALPKGRRRVALLRTLAHDGLAQAQTTRRADVPGRDPDGSGLMAGYGLDSERETGGGGRDDVAAPRQGNSLVVENVEQPELATLAPEITAGIFDDATRQ